MTTIAQRSHLHALMVLLLAHEPTVHYAQIRPMTTRYLTEPGLYVALESVGVTMDCSEAVTLLCRLAGLKDPNGLGYNGSGYTGTLLNHLPHYSDPKGANIGALVVLGPHTGDHVCMVMERHATNPLLWSHGYEGGPRAVRLVHEAAVHRPPVTFLNISKL